MEKPLFYVFFALLLVSACDNQGDDAYSDITINVCASGASSPLSKETASPVVSSTFLSRSQAIDASVFPEKRHLTPATGFGVGGKIIDAAEELNESVYALVTIPSIINDHGILRPINSYGSGFSLPKHTSQDSVDMYVKMFILEKPGITYPDTLVIAYQASGVLDTMRLVTNKHMIRLEDQAIVQGSEVNQLPQFPGIGIHVSSPVVDTTDVVFSIINDHEDNGRPSSWTIFHVNPVRTEIGSSACQASYDEYVQRKFVHDTKIRSFLLKNPFNR